MVHPVVFLNAYALPIQINNE